MPPRAIRAIDPKAVELARPAVFTGDRERQVRRLVGTIADPARLAILRALRRTPLAASDLALVIGRTRSAASQHLRVLREVDAVATERHGNVIRYRLADTTPAQVLADVADAFDRLAA
jgi:DNA-binding transcriptional ArsR family regulator